LFNGLHNLVNQHISTYISKNIYLIQNIQTAQVFCQLD